MLRNIGFILFVLSFELIAADMPANAHKNVYGIGWECDRGFHRSGSDCSKVAIPRNAKLNIYGNGWKCNRGFHRSGNGCLKVSIPENAKLNIYGNGWQCNRGYAPKGKKCIEFSVPKNASINPSGNSWNCNLNYKRSNSICAPMTEQELAYQNLLIMQARACGNSYNYDVTGYCGDEYVYGNVDACSNSKDVSGSVTFDNGAEQSFEGDWVSKGEIEGYDGFGNSCELEVD